MTFELTDSPWDPNAECLFSGDGIKIKVLGIRVDSGDNLSSRMYRVQQFINSVFDEKVITKIVMYINVEAGDEFQVIEVKVNEFTIKMLELFEKEDNWTPSVKLVIETV